MQAMDAKLKLNTYALLEKLEGLGSAQNRKIYARHGVGENQFGVSFSDLRKLVKEIGYDNDQAEMLWRSGNHDARLLAVMISDADGLTEERIERRAADLDNSVLTDAFSELVSRSAFARKKMRVWVEAASEWVSSAGWNLVSQLAMRADDFSNEEGERLLNVIQASIHQRPNRTRYSMNNALIAIGTRNESLRRQAEKAARIIGKVAVDHGQTSCKTPDALGYLQRTWQRKKTKPEKPRQLTKSETR